MTRWEYMEVEVKNLGNQNICNELGKQGWELVSAYNVNGSYSVLLFKRPIQ